MLIDIVPYSPEHKSLVIKFCEETWDHPRSADFYRWRYDLCPNQVGILAIDKGKCLAMLWAFDRQYQSSSGRKRCLEICDWACHPHIQGSGVGVMVMQKMMEQADMFVSVGGTDFALGLLPRLKWKNQGELMKYIFPYGGGRLSSYVQERLGLPGFLVKPIVGSLGKLWFRPRSVTLPPHGRVDYSEKINPEVISFYDQSPEFFPVPDLTFLNWLMSPDVDMGKYIPLHFYINDVLCGWSLSRVYSTPNGKEARLIESHLAPSYADHIDWVIGATNRVLSSEGADITFVMTNMPSIQRALKKNRFLPFRPEPLHVWEKEGENSSLCLQGNTGDAFFLPYPKS